MQNPYNKYQSQQVAQTAKRKGKTSAAPTTRRVQKPMLKKKKAPKINMSLILASFAGLSLSFYIFAYTEDFMKVAGRIRIGISQSMAADEENSADQDGKKGESSAQLPVGKVSGLSSNVDHLTMKNANVFEALKEKSAELEKKERRLVRLEEDLQKQKDEIERQLKEMKEMRRNISSKLEKKVTADQESVNKLVDVYSSMKPQNAAVIFSQLDEDLAIKVMGKMKKQNAAEILNHVEPKKAQRLSEKYAGLKE